MKRSLVAASLVAVMVGIHPAPVQAAVNCERTGTQLDIVVAGGGDKIFLLTRDSLGPAGDIDVLEIDTGFPPPGSQTTHECEDATVTNIDLIDIQGTDPLREVLIIDTNSGLFVPGATNEGPADSEIEIVVRLKGGDDASVVFGGSGTDLFTMGSAGVNLNQDNDADDVTFAPSVELTGFEGGSAEDVLKASGGNATGGPFQLPVFLAGGSAQDVVRGGTAGDLIQGGADNDLLLGMGGNDRLGEIPFPSPFPLSESEPGDDTLKGGPGGDVLRGSIGFDTLIGGPGDDEEHGGDDDDHFKQGDARDGSDTLFGGLGTFDLVRYENRSSRLRVSLDNARNDGARGEKDAVGFQGDIEQMNAGRKSDVLVGNSRANYIKGFGGSDLISGLGAIDQLFGSGGGDGINGGTGNDSLRGNSGDDDLNGGPNTDSCLGGPGQDTLTNCE
jgi:hypothetical protein